MRWLAVAVVATACGRLNFDPFGTAPGDGNPSTTGSDGSGAPGSDAPGIDAPVTACTAAMPVTVNQPITISTCATGTDLFDGCAGPALDEVVFSFLAPVSGGYTVRTFASGTMNIITTANVDGPCASNAGCFGMKSAPMTAGQTLFFAVEASTGACQMIDFSITMP